MIHENFASDMALNLKKLGTVSRLLKRSFRKYAGLFSVMVGLGMIGGLFESIGIATVIPLFSLMTGQSVGAADTISRFIAWLFHLLHLTISPAKLLALMVLLFIGKGVVQFVVRYSNALIVTGFEEKLRRIVMQRALHARWPFLLQQKAGHIDSILLYDVEQSATLLSTIVNTIVTGATFAAYTIVAFTISWRIALITIVIGGILFWILKPVFYHIRQLIIRVAAVQKEMNHHIAEHMVSVKSLKAMAMEAPVIREAFGMFAKLRKARNGTALYRQASLAVMDPIAFLIIAVLFLVSYRSPDFSMVSFGIVMFLVQRMFSYINAMSAQIQMVNQQYPYLKAVMDWRRQTRENKEIDTGTAPFRMKHELSFQNVTFGYRDNTPILNNLSLHIPRGQLIGIAGPSGAGKTTIGDLILRLFEPFEGVITADGTDIRNIGLRTWRRHMGYVPQDGVLLNASVKENIRFYGTATDADIEIAARAANIHDVITALPKGYDTPVGERGVTLSGGQRQRIILARALVRKPDILILDEATSAVDAESEKLIHETVAALRGKATVIVITHRLSAIQYLDRLVVLEGGAIVEDGTPKELSEREGSYLARLTEVDIFK